MLSDPKVIVYCDTPGCAESEEFGLTVTARGYDERNVEGQIKSAGWTELSDNVHMCPTCKEEAEEE